VSADLFLNVYQDFITFVVELPLRMGLPNLSAATVQYQNVEGNIYAYGGEAELSWHPHSPWSYWCNLGIRETIQEGERRLAEPRFKINLGGRYQPDAGLLLDVSLHYVSEYRMPLKDPNNLLDSPTTIPLGNHILLIGRLGYRINLPTITMEVGLAIRSPLGSRFREYPGIPMPPSLGADSPSDYGGEYIVRRAIFYLRGSL
jgi:hypothetical protein